MVRSLYSFAHFSFLISLLYSIQLGSASYTPSKGTGDREGYTAKKHGPRAETAHGIIEGTKDTFKTWSGKSINSFRGVRYALPPTGHLRFKSPVPLKPWTGVRKAVEDGASCPQPSSEYFYGQTSEDCLFLNVYTKDLSGDKPVIVFFHPGAFCSQSGRSDVFGPQYLLDRDVVLVVVNYRLGALGFLSTGDGEVKGNMGFKDQVAALKWVQENAKAFGGDPEHVTIAGYSVGATSALLHMVSPSSKGLFERVIAMSGGATAGWVVNKDPLKLAKKLGQSCGCDTSNTQRLIKCLRELSAQSIVEHYNELKEWGKDPAVIFGAVIEKNSDGFLTGDPKAIIKSGNFHQVPVVIGFTKNEMDGKITDLMTEDESLKNELDKDWDRLAPIAFYLERGTEKTKSFCKDIRQSYFSGGAVNTKGLSKIYSDALVVYGAENTAKLLAKYSKEPVYFYQSGYQGRYSYNYKKGTQEPYGVMHMDDLLYILPYTGRFPIFKTSDKEALMVQAYTSMWTNFAHSGDPTPENVDLEWKPLKPDNFQYLSFEDNCSIKPNLPFKERVEFWEKHYSGSLDNANQGKPHVHEHRPQSKPHY